MEQQQEKGLGLKLSAEQHARVRGGARFGPLLLVLPLAFAFGFGLRALRSSPATTLLGEALSEREAANLPDVHAAVAVDGFGQSHPLDPGQLVIRLAPLEAVPAVQAFIAKTWATRLGLEDGEPWRLDLVLSADAEPLILMDIRIEDAAGLALRAPALSSDSHDPRAALLRPRSEPLLPSMRRELVLWGRRPGEGLRLLVGELEVDLDAVHFHSGELPRWLAAPGPLESEESAVRQAQLPETSDRNPGVESGAASGDSDPMEAEADASDDQARLEERVRELEGEVLELKTRRVERELAWHEYNRALAALDIDHIVAAFAVEEDTLRDNGLIAEEIEGQSEAEAAAAMERTQREREIERSVRSLLTLEGFSGLDLLELGPTRGAVGAGPAIFRMLDDRGRLLGSLNAKVLRLEASRSARTITLVLEDGFESRGGNKVPFSNGSRRLLIPYVDPEPWIEALPELFGDKAFNTQIDDDTWQLEVLRRELNRLLALDTSAGWWRLRGIGGVMGNTLRDIQLEQLGDDGSTRRRIFADRLRILVEDPGLLLIMEDGAIVRGTNKTPFVDGSYRLFLPSAPLEEWRAANIPRSGT